MQQSSDISADVEPHSVVAIGASAGGAETLRRVVGGLPVPDRGGRPRMARIGVGRSGTWDDGTAGLAVTNARGGMAMQTERPQAARGVRPATPEMEETS